MEEGDPCPISTCNGAMHHPPAENCSCHLGHPPCSSCTNVELECKLCGQKEPLSYERLFETLEDFDRSFRKFSQQFRRRLDADGSAELDCLQDELNAIKDVMLEDVFTGDIGDVRRKAAMLLNKSERENANLKDKIDRLAVSLDAERSKVASLRKLHMPYEGSW